MSGTLGEDLNTGYCCRGPKFVVRTLLCNAEYFYVLLTVTSCSAIRTERIVAFQLQTVVTRTRRSLKLYVHYLCCFNVRYNDKPVMVVIPWLGNRYSCCTYH